MKVFLLRHADAEIEAATDAERALSAKGVAQSERLSAFCKKRAQVPEVILHSPLKRARQTAEIFGKGVSLPRLIEVPWLDCGMTPAVALEKLASYAEFSSVMLVGHEPDFSNFAAACLGLADASALHLRKASLTCLELADFAEGAGRLEFLLPARLTKP